MSNATQGSPPGLGLGLGLGLASGVGMVVANMIGAGVFLSAGFMAQDLSPGWIMLAWVVGAGLALTGCRVYATAAALVPRSGGEYRYLSALLHPVVGYLAGWTSFLVGFSAPIAVDALAAGAFARTLWPGIEPRIVAACLVVGLTALHAFNLRTSVWSQNTLVLIKALLLLGFLGMGLFAGENAWPTWSPPGATGDLPLGAFMGSLFFIAFAFSGWNAAVYAAEEFRNPGRDVGRAMLIGCAGVALLYLAINWVFVANLTPVQAQVVRDYETSRVTLGHLIARDLLGEAGGRLMSALLILAFVSAMSAMTFLGPRVYAAMAADGLLPRALVAREGRPPVLSVLLQGALALTLVFAYDLQQVLYNIGAILTLFSALVGVSLIRARVRALPVPLLSLLCAVLYVSFAGWMLYFGFRDKNSTLFLWIGAVAAVAAAAYWLTAILRDRTKNSA